MEQLIQKIRELKMNKKVLVLGAAVIDMIIEIDRLPKSGEDVAADQKESIVGGCAYNVSGTLNYLNLNHDLGVPVGKGHFAETIRKQLKEDGIDILIEDESQDNGWCLSIVEKDGERTFITMAGLETHWKSEWFHSIDIGDYDFIYVNGYEVEGSGEVILKALEKKKETCKIIFDPSPRVGFIDQATLTKLLSMGTIIHLNHAELKSLTKENDLQQALKRAFDMTCEPVIVTLGAEGTIYYTENESELVPTKKVTVVDTIGAGDSHTGGLIAGLTAGLSLGESCELGNQLANIIVQQQGGKLGLNQ